MRRYTDPLSRVRVAAPCSMDWDQMIGDERARFCAKCQLNVYNFSGMSRREAEALISRAEGRLCVRYYRRGDGTILTENCPVGLRAIKNRLSKISRAIASTVLSFLAGLGFYTALNKLESVVMTESQIESNQVMGVIAVKPVSSTAIANGLYEREVLGRMAIPAVRGEMVKLRRGQKLNSHSLSR